MLRDHQNNHHNVRLEWIVIWLIVVRGLGGSLGQGRAGRRCGWRGLWSGQLWWLIVVREFGFRVSARGTGVRGLGVPWSRAGQRCGLGGRAGVFAAFNVPGCVGIHAVG